jgi:hypothetical protein
MRYALLLRSFMTGSGLLLRCIANGGWDLPQTEALRISLNYNLKYLPCLIKKNKNLHFMCKIILRSFDQYRCQRPWRKSYGV